MYANKYGEDNSPYATSTPSNTNTNTNNNNNTTGTVQAGAPIVTTSSNVSPSDTTAIVNGNVNPRGAFTTYWYEYGSTASLGNKTNNQIVGSGFVSISAPGYITGLSKSSPYYFRLVALNQYGTVAGNTHSFNTTTGNPAPVGNAPTVRSVAASGVSRTTANINGEVAPNKAGTQYWFEYGKTTELGNTSAFSSAGDGSAKTSVSVSLSDLDPLTTYYFRINAQNQFGTVNGSILNFKTLGPSSAKAPTATTGVANSVASTSATLNGAVNPNLAATSFWFEYSTDSLLGSILLESTDPVSIGSGSAPVALSKVVTGLDSKTTYYFRIVAQNNMGTVRGDKVTFKTR